MVPKKWCYNQLYTPKRKIYRIKIGIKILNTFSLNLGLALVGTSSSIGTSPPTESASPKILK